MSGGGGDAGREEGRDDKVESEAVCQRGHKVNKRAVLSHNDQYASHQVSPLESKEKKIFTTSLCCRETGVEVNSTPSRTYQKS